MAKLPSVKSIRREDLSPDAPSWVDNLLGTLTIFMESVYSALNKDITFTENIACNIREFVINTKNNYTSGNFDAFTFPSGLRSKPNGVIVLSVTNQTNPDTLFTSAVSLDWRDLSGQIQIRNITGLDNSKKYTIKVMVI